MPNFNEQAWLDGFVNEAAAMGLDKDAAHELLKTAVRRDMMESDPAFAAGFQGELEKAGFPLEEGALLAENLGGGAARAARSFAGAVKRPPAATAENAGRMQRLTEQLRPASGTAAPAEAATGAPTAHPPTAAANAADSAGNVEAKLNAVLARLQAGAKSAPAAAAPAAAKPGFLGKHPGVALAGGAALAGPATLGLQEMLRRFNVGWGHNPEEQDAMNMLFEASRGRGDIRGSTAAASHYLREAARRQNAMFGGYSMFPGEGRYPYGGGFYPGV